MSEPLRVWQGVRLIAINMAQVGYGVPQGECIFLDCMDCEQSIKLYYADEAANNATSDKEAMSIFRKYGWAVIPNRIIRCPKCRKTKVRAKNTP